MHNTPNTSNSPRKEAQQKGTINTKKAVRRSLIALLVATGLFGVGAGISIYNSNKKKQADSEQFGKIELKNDTARSISSQYANQVYLTLSEGELDSVPLPTFLTTMLEKNSDILGVDSSLSDITTNDSDPTGFALNHFFSVMISENNLKTNSFLLDWDKNYLEDNGVERSKHSSSNLGKLLGTHGEGSYGWWQVQRVAIDEYKKDPERFRSICSKIANFKLPNKQKKREPLYKQFGFQNEEGMIAKIMDHSYDLYSGGNRLSIAMGAVLLSEMRKSYEDPLRQLDKDKLYNEIGDNIGKVDKAEIKSGKGRALGLPGGSKRADELLSVYLLNDQGEVSFSYISNILLSERYSLGALSALRCSSLEAPINGYYLTIFNLAELNEQFHQKELNKSYDGKLEITTPTGTFGPTSAKLAAKYISFPDDVAEERKNDPQKYKGEIKKYLDENPEIVENFAKKVFDDYSRNRRVFFYIGDNEYTINEYQEIRLQENLKLSFDHFSVCVEAFEEFLGKRYGSKSGKVQEFHNLYNELCVDQNKDSYYKMINILTKKSEFMGFTGLGEKEYNHFIKYSLGRLLLGVTKYICKKTLPVIPFIQSPADIKHNETNTLQRFAFGVDTWGYYQWLLRKGIPCRIEKGENPMDFLKKTAFQDKRFHVFWERSCWKTDGEPIETAEDIPDILICKLTNMDAGKISMLQEGDSVYLKTQNLEQFYTKTSDVFLAKKGEFFRSIIFNYQQQDPGFRKILCNLIGKDNFEENDITADIISQVIRHPDRSKWEHINGLKAGEQYIIIYPLNRAPNSNITGIISKSEPKELDSSEEGSYQKPQEKKDEPRNNNATNGDQHKKPQVDNKKSTAQKEVSERQQARKERLEERQKAKQQARKERQKAKQQAREERQKAKQQAKKKK